MDGNDTSLPSEDTPVVFPGLEAALIGFGRQYTGPKLAVYSAKKMLECFQADDGMTKEEAVEWFDFNVSTLWVGPNTPLILDDEDDVA